MNIFIGIMIPYFRNSIRSSLRLYIKKEMSILLNKILLGFTSGAIITRVFSTRIISVLSYLLSFAAGAMIYVVVEDLIPESSKGRHSNLATIGFSIGFFIMMILDGVLG